MKNRNRLTTYSSFLIAMLSSIPSNISFSQPYIWKIDTMSDPRKPMVEQNSDYKLFRIDLHTGIVDTVLPHAGTVEDHFVTPDQSKIFLAYRGSALMVNAINFQERKLFKFDGQFQLVTVLDGAKINRTYCTFENQVSDDKQLYTLVFDRTTFAKIDSLTDFVIGENVDSSSPPYYFFSNDQRFIYHWVSDRSKTYDFEVFDTETNRRVGSRTCGGINNLVYGPSYRDGRDGKAVVGYKESSGFESQKYAILNVDSSNISTTLLFPKRSEPRLSTNAKYVFIEQVNWTAVNGNPEYRTGNVHIYETVSGKLVQKLTLPPEGKYLFFENYPDQFFYYLPSDQRSISINLSEFTTILTLNPTFALAGSQSFNFTISGSNFVNISTVLWNNAPRATTFASSSELRSFVLASDIDTIGVGDVTVSTPEGRVSNSLSFYVISAVNWVDTLISYKHKAADLGWLKSKQDDDCDDDEKPDDGVIRNLDKRLDKVKKELLRKDSSKARNELEKFVKKLDRLRKRSEEAEARKRPTQVVITIEGYDLLKTNTEYLIDRLPDRKPKKGSKDRD